MNHKATALGISLAVSCFIVMGFGASIARGQLPQPWFQAGSDPADYEMNWDAKESHGGKGSIYIKSKAAEPKGFGTVMQNSKPGEYLGKRVRMSAFVKSDKIEDWAGLWLRVDGPNHATLGFDNMQNRPITGTTDWKKYEIVLDVPRNSEGIAFGILLAGNGGAWVDDLKLEVVDTSVPTTNMTPPQASRDEQPKIAGPKTALDLDHQFDSGSGIAMKELTRIQIENLAMLGRVWGFLKYYHPTVTSGQFHWDYELFRVLPAILNATDRARANDYIAHWIESLGAVAECNPCAKLDESEIHLRPDLGWISDEARLGKGLSQSLRSIRDNRVPGRQFYVSLVPSIRNPSFDHELGYGEIKLPDAGFQLLGLYRFWNIIEYWFPYRDVMSEDWEKVLIEFIPRIALAKDSESYQRELMALIAKVHDGHANLWSSLDVRPPTGKCELPVKVRFIENRAVVAGYTVAEAGKASGLEIGDVITELDGEPVAKLVEKWAPYYAASNDAARLRDIAAFMTRGSCGEPMVGVRRDGKDIMLKAQRVTLAKSEMGPGTHDLPGETFRLLSKDVAYLKLSSVKAADAPHYVEAAVGAKGLIIDIRNYPSEFVVFALGSLLVDGETPFARFTFGDLSNPGAFHWTQPFSLNPQMPHYAGKVVILVDEISLSQAEYTTMAFRAAPGAKVVGSTTSGNDGNVSPIALPGGLRAMISGIGVFYPDKRPTQRIGIVPDVEVRPTIAGIRAGRDEVLEEAVRQILGGNIPADQIEKISKP